MPGMPRFLAGCLALLVACSAGGLEGSRTDLGSCSATQILREGDRLPDCRFETLAGGQVVATSDLEGRPTVLNFWASWCLACQKEMPAIDRYAAANPEVRVLGVDVIGVQGETLEAGRAYFARRGVSYESLADRDGQFYGLFGTTSRPIMPLTIVLDEEGVVRGRRFGELTQAELAELVDTALAG